MRCHMTRFSTILKDDFHMKVKNLKKFEKKLLSMKEEIINKLQELRSQRLEHSKDGVIDEIEIYHHDMATGLNLELQERYRLTLLRIEKALHKIQQKKYGFCESCGSQIEIPRLEAQPLARLCISCMHEADQSHYSH